MQRNSPPPVEVSSARDKPARGGVYVFRREKMADGNAVAVLRQQTIEARALLENMKDILGDDAEMIQNCVLGETDLNEAIAAALGRLVEVNTLIFGLDMTAERIKARATRLEAQRDTIKTAILTAMEASQMKRFEHPLGTLSVKATAPKVLIRDEALIPSTFWKPSDPTLDKKAIAKAIKDGALVPGASLSNGGTTLQLSLG